MNRSFFNCLTLSSPTVAILLLAAAAAAAAEKPFRPPAVPLVTCDPYFSIWSETDRLTDEPTKHWTGASHPLTAYLRMADEEKIFRVMGDDARFPPLEQKSVTILPTRTIYTMEGAGIRLTLTFMTPALPDDLMVFSRPVTYLTWTLQSLDGKPHDVTVSLFASPLIAVHDPKQIVDCYQEPNATMRVGSRDQPLLQRKGDAVRIDWGYLYICAPSQAAFSGFLEQPGWLTTFLNGGGTSSAPLKRHPGRGEPADEAVQLGVAIRDLRIHAEPVSRWLMLAYDDIYSINYFDQKLRPYWRRNGADAAELLKTSARDYESLCKRCAAFDEELMTDARKLGGEKYAQLCALAYRQCIAGNKLCADANSQPLLFPKENTSNGCIATVDVIYPMAPQFLLFGPSLTKAMLVPVMDYSASPRWKFDSAPHDLGQYPRAIGQRYGGGEDARGGMPVEESGNLIILLAALAKMEGNADFAGKYWPTITKWAEYLKANGIDPEHQLCTDDFMGPMPRNVNLSAKTVVALGAYAKLCRMRGEHAQATAYEKTALQSVDWWLKEADDGDHFRLGFGNPGTWSQKYNLVWDRLLNLNLFPAAALKKEMAFYRKTLDRYGLPLDNRKPQAKTDWTLWTATLTGDRADFEALVTPVYDYLNETLSRVPMNDLYFTKEGREVGMHARPVVGGVFLQMLYEDAIWKKWASRDGTRATGWAPFPTPPKLTTIVPAGDEGTAVWRYTTEKPSADWLKPEFDAAAWKEGAAPLGRLRPDEKTVRTEWTTPGVWLRREVNLPDAALENLGFRIHHEEQTEIYVNGVFAVHAWNCSAYELFEPTAAARAALKPGKNTIAVYARQGKRSRFLDVGLVSKAGF
jgi:hypothetical protein